jgi:hypothetical protein
MVIIFANPSDQTKLYRLDYNWHSSCEVFVSSHDGEGMSTTRQELFDMIDKWFDDTYNALAALIPGVKMGANPCRENRLQI